jgi:serine/threonine-protein kinase
MDDDIKKIGKYDIVSQVGSGAMGVVYKGLDPIINRHVAIKTLSWRGTDSEGEQLAARFRQEAQAAGRLNHPGIVSVYEYGEDGDVAYIAMELVEGYTLTELAEHNIRLTIEDVWNLMLKVLDALHYAHGKGVIHRDIKPSNIMRTASGEVKIADFGIARIESSELTQFGTVIGTPGYMSPEQLLGQRVDHRSDIFSCGILFYELLTGESAFSGTNITSTIYKVVHTELPPASKLCPTVPEPIDAVLAKALAKNPEYRFSSAQEFAQAIKSVFLGENKTAAAEFATDPDSEKTLIQPPKAQTSDPIQAMFGTNGGPETNLNTALKENPVQMLGSAPGVGPGVNPAVDQFPHDPYEKLKPSEPRRTQAKRKKSVIIGLSVLVLGALVASALIWLPAVDDSGRGSAPPERASSPATSDDSPEPVAPPVAGSPAVTPSYTAGAQFRDCQTCPQMIVLPQGSFTQGSPHSEPGRQPDEGPQHTVHIDYPLAVGQYEVTRRQFAQFVSETRYESAGCSTYDGSWDMRDDRNWQAPGFDQHDSEPVTCVSWVDARKYVDWLARKTGKNYRLLSSAEWEYVARAGTQTARSWGDDPDTACWLTNVADQATRDHYPGWEIHNCMDGYLYTAPAEAFKSNGFGVYATLGNVFEWVEDCWNDSYRGAPDDGSAWTQGDCTRRLLRGGSWYSQPQYVRSAFRNHFDRNSRASTFGIRVARELPSG